MKREPAQIIGVSLLRSFSRSIKFSGLGLIFLGAVVFAYGLPSIYVVYATASWPQIDGNIVGSEIVSFVSTTQDSDGRSSTQTFYGPEVSYRYQIAGKEYQAKTIRKGGVVNTAYPRNAKKILLRYPQGSTVRVYYNIEDPTDAVLESGLQPSTWFVAGLGLSILAFGYVVRRITVGIFDVLLGAKSGNKKHREKARSARSESSVYHRDLFGNWQVIAQEPSQEELLAVMMKEAFHGDASGTVAGGKTTMIYSIREDEIIVSHGGGLSLGGPMRSRYTVEGDRLLLDHQISGLLSMLAAKFLPEYFQYRCRGASMELTTNPIAAYNNQQIRYRLELQN